MAARPGGCPRGGARPARRHMSVLDRKELEQSPLADLHAIASELGVESYRRLRKEELISGSSRARTTTAAPRVTRRPTRRPTSRPRRGRDAEDEPEPGGGARRRGRGRGRGGRGAGGGGRARGGGRPHRACSTSFRTAAASCDRTRSRTRATTSTSPRPDPPLRAARRRRGHRPRASAPALGALPVARAGGQRQRLDPEPPAERARFEHLTPVFASERLPAPEGLDAAPYGKRLARGDRRASRRRRHRRCCAGSSAPWRRPARPRSDRRARGRAP